MDTDLEIVHLALRTGNSFKKVFGHMEELLKYSVNGKIGFADEGNTFFHSEVEYLLSSVDRVTLKKRENTVVPMYGVRLTVVENATLRIKPRGQFGKEYIFIAKNSKGLKEIYDLVSIYTENFYYRGNISLEDVFYLSKNVIVIAENFVTKNRIDYIGLSPRTPSSILRKHKDIPRVALCDNYYPNPWDKKVYELLTAPNNTENKTTPQHIMSTVEWREHFRDYKEDLDKAIKNTHKIAGKCNARLKKAPMIKSIDGEDIESLCVIGAKNKGINISKGKYKKRYEREIKLIKEKDYVDYFLVVADLIQWSKKRMFVGPSRGSCAGSLVCFLLDITSVDPIPYDLIFERFIDINRSDLPDIDIDFPDDKRESVIRYLRKKYGEEKVKQIATISKLKPKSAIVEWAKGLRIPEYETDELKNAIVTRSGGDARAGMCLLDTLETTEVGKEFIERHPSMRSVSKIEDHPSHSGIHAAGVIVCNKPIRNFVGVNIRSGHNVVMTERKGAEYLNLLKIDILGLRTLSILADCCAQIKMDFRDFYTLPLDDEKTYEIFNQGRLNGIFQFEGYSLRNITRQMGIHLFEDIVAITSLARPGALYSGGAARYIKYRLGKERPVFVGEEHYEITKNTFSIVVYQEQILRMCREVGGMSWYDVGMLRRALSKSLGKEFFNKYKKKFMKGAKKRKYSKADSEFMWGEIENGGAYAFNKSHAVAYGMISYWCAYLKRYHPLEFLVANLRNSKGKESARNILRESVINEGVKYVPVDADSSLANWSVRKGVVTGGLMNIDGIAAAGAKKIIEARTDSSIKLGPSMTMKLVDPKTFFDILFPTEHYWGDIFKRPKAYGLKGVVSEVKDVIKQGAYTFIGQLKNKNIRDLNEYVNLMKRGGKVLKKDTLTLSIRIEDDTDIIMCNVGRNDYERIGRDVAEHGIVDESWYIVKGAIKRQARYIDIDEIQLLTEDLLEK